MADCSERARNLLLRSEQIFVATPPGDLPPVLKSDKTAETPAGVLPFGLKSDEVLPYKSVDDVIQFLKYVSENDLPKWVSETAELTPGTSYCYSQSQAVQKYRVAYKRNSVPKTLVCHDFKGGYLEDRLVSANWDGNGDYYTFSQWCLIDVFVYFSHHLVTVPPVCWINAGHAHGVSVLGTLITEGKEGVSVWSTLLTSPVVWEWFADALVLICQVHKFDGYLLNVENALTTDQVPKIKKFVEYLRGRLPLNCLVIWYDSVTVKGELWWQNALNARNVDFFSICDGIFLNYNYRNWQLKKSSLLAGSRKHDVYVGVDVFGRGCPGNGFMISDAVAMAREHDLSVAVFAPGWTRESAPGIPILNDRILWASLSRYLYVHGTGDTGRPKYLLGGESGGEKNFNDLVDDEEGDVFRWTGEKAHILFALIPPSTNLATERRVVLDDAVVTFREKSVEEFYAQLPPPALIVNHLGNYSYDMGTATSENQVAECDIPLMFFELPLRGGVKIDLETKVVLLGRKEYMKNPKEPQAYVVIDETGNGKLRTYKFGLGFDEVFWNKNTFTMKSDGILMEVGMSVPPYFLASVKTVKIVPSAPNADRSIASD